MASLPPFPSFTGRKNDQAQQPGGLTERFVSKNRNGRPVC
jgi:hypothetical protein